MSQPSAERRNRGWRKIFDKATSGHINHSSSLTNTKDYEGDDCDFTVGDRFFLGRDPIAEAGGVNLYAFVGNDPVNAWDYLGMSFISPTIAFNHPPMVGTVPVTNGVLSFQIADGSEYDYFYNGKLNLTPTGTNGSDGLQVPSSGRLRAGEGGDLRNRINNATVDSMLDSQMRIGSFLDGGVQTWGFDLEQNLNDIYNRSMGSMGDELAMAAEEARREEEIAQAISYLESLGVTNAKAVLFKGADAAFSSAGISLNLISLEAGRQNALNSAIRNGDDISRISSGAKPVVLNTTRSLVGGAGAVFSGGSYLYGAWETGQGNQSYVALTYDGVTLVGAAAAATATAPTGGWGGLAVGAGSMIARPYVVPVLEQGIHTLDVQITDFSYDVQQSLRASGNEIQNQFNNFNFDTIRYGILYGNPGP